MLNKAFNRIAKNSKRLVYIASAIVCLSCSKDSGSETEILEESSQNRVFYKGMTMGFVKHQEEYGNVVFKENGISKDPFTSLYEHGANIVRFRIDLPPYKNNYTRGKPDVDFRSPEKVKQGIFRAQNAGLKIQLTFSYKSMALEAEDSKNNYVAPLRWQPVAGNVPKLKDSVYQHTYNVLKDYISSGIVPEIVSIGNETNWRILEENLREDELPAYSSSRTVSLLNSGSKAVRDINSIYASNIKIAFHIYDVSSLKWWMDEHVPKGLDFDVLGLSHYHAWHSLGTFKTWKEVIDWTKSKYDKEFFILETAQLFTNGGNDSHVDILGLDNIPNGYPNPPTTETQKKYLSDFAQEIYNAGGLGLIVWGGEWVGSNTLIFPDQWGAGSSWENKAFWDFNYNLHDGVNWMNEIVEQ